MRRRRFEDLVVSVATSRSGKRGLALPASIGVHAAILGAVVVAPLLTSSDLPPAVQAKPAPIPDFLVHVTPPAPTKGGPAPTLAPTRAPRPRAETPLDSPSLEPRALPPGLDGVPDGDRELAGCSICHGNGASDGAMGDPSTGETAAPPRTVRAGMGIRPPTKMKHVAPVYPDLARRAGVEGVVIIECTIDPSGRVVNMRVLRGHPLLDAAALDAVQQWAYRPTLLNGVPVSVIMTVTVMFALRRP